MRNGKDPDFNHRSMNDLKIIQQNNNFGAIDSLLFDKCGEFSQTLIFQEMEFIIDKYLPYVVS